MNSLLRKSIFLVGVFQFACVVAAAQTTPKNLVNPPNWIWGEWANLSVSEPNKIEWITFSEDEIELVQKLGDTPAKFSRKFRKHQIKETAEGQTYRIVVSNSKEEMVWEFTMCPRDKCSLVTEDALSYSYHLNKKKLWDHSGSMQKILVRRARHASRAPASKTAVQLPISTSN
jgi:hypothetical protein